MGLCSTFRELAQSTWHRIAKSRRVDFHTGEETITDLNLLELKDRHPDQVFTYTFNRIQEGKTGADWEWWFLGRNGRAFSFRVQAKIIKHKTDKYESLHYKQGQQCRDLIGRAVSDFPQVPLYCLYTETDGRVFFRHPWFGCPGNVIGSEEYGCSLMSAFKVHSLYKQGDRDTSVDNLAPHFVPWHCLVCEPVGKYSQNDLPDLVYRLWRRTFIRQEEVIIGEEEIELDSDLSALFREYRDFEPLDGPPDYVRAVMTGEAETGDLNISEETGRITVFRDEE